MTKSFIFSYYNAELKVSDWSFEMKNNIQVYNVITVGTSGSSSLIKELCIDHVESLLINIMAVPILFPFYK